MTFVKSTHLMIKMRTYLYMFMICIKYWHYYILLHKMYIANLTCIATWPKYTIFGWGCHIIYGTLTDKIARQARKNTNLVENVN